MNTNNSKTAIILAAGIGSRLASKTTLPKALLSINQKSILDNMLSALEAAQVERVIMVLGHRAELIIESIKQFKGSFAFEFIYNNEYSTKGNAHSLSLALSLCRDSFLVLDADVIFAPEILISFNQQTNTSALLVGRGDALDQEASKVLSRHQTNLSHFADKRDLTSDELTSGEFQGEAIGIFKINQEDIKAFQAATHYVIQQNAHSQWEQILNTFAKDQIMKIFKTDNLQWVEIDTPEDLNKAIELFK